MKTPAVRIYALSIAFFIALLCALTPVGAPNGYAQSSSGSSLDLVEEPNGLTSADSATKSEATADGSYIVELTKPSLLDDVLSSLDQNDVDAAEVQRKLGTKKFKKKQRALTKLHEDVADEVNVEPQTTFSTVLNGFSAELTAKQVKKLESLDEVKSVTPERIFTTNAVTTVEHFGLNSATGLWNQVGGGSQAGKGVVVGVLDSGIAPENPSFAGSTLSFNSSNPDEPHYVSLPNGSTAIQLRKADGSLFTGACEEGFGFTAANCSTKIVTARYFDSGPQSGSIMVPSGEYFSPRDQAGHGSHTAAIAAGNLDIAATYQSMGTVTISGVAPQAKLAIYKVCWRDALLGGNRCAESDLVAGIDAAVQDGVDVINLSVGSNSADDEVDGPVDLALLRAASSGVFVSASAGNAGTTGSLDHTEPWVTTVASDRTDQRATVKVGTQEFAGLSTTVFSETEQTAPLTQDRSSADARECRPGSLDAQLQGTVVLCLREGTPAQDTAARRLEQSAEVARVGGVGMVLANQVSSSSNVAAEAHSVPTIHVGANSGLTLVQLAFDISQATSSYLPIADQLVQANQVSLLSRAAQGTTSNLATIKFPLISDFSSRGPAKTAHSNIIKPDVSAPGSQILSAYAPAQGNSATYQFSSGTSMAAPHVAGLAAIYRSVHPDAAPAEIKSALMTTAAPTYNTDQSMNTDSFAQGAGEVSPNLFLNPGFYYPAGADDWNGFLNGLGVATGTRATPIHGSDLNQASLAIGALDEPRNITRTVRSTQAGDYRATANLPGFDVSVDPAQIHFTAAGQTATIEISISRTTAPLDEFTHGSIRWENLAQSPSATNSADSLFIMAVRPVAVSDEPPLAELPALPPDQTDPPDNQNPPDGGTPTDPTDPEPPVTYPVEPVEPEPFDPVTSNDPDPNSAGPRAFLPQGLPARIAQRVLEAFDTSGNDETSDPDQSARTLPTADDLFVQTSSPASSTADNNNAKRGSRQRIDTPKDEQPANSATTAPDSGSLAAEPGSAPSATSKNPATPIEVKWGLVALSLLGCIGCVAAITMVIGQNGGRVR